MAILSPSFQASRAWIGRPNEKSAIRVSVQLAFKPNPATDHKHTNNIRLKGTTSGPGLEAGGLLAQSCHEIVDVSQHYTLQDVNFIPVV